MKNKTIKSHNVVGIYVSYLDSAGGKRRPVLIIKNQKGDISFFRMTSQYHNKSLNIKKNYYPIKYWKEAGLKKQSWIDTGKILMVDLASLDSVTKIGTLKTEDIKGLTQFIINSHKSIT